jgi:hypothetical protein
MRARTKRPTDEIGGEAPGAKVPGDSETEWSVRPQRWIDDKLGGTAAEFLGGLSRTRDEVRRQHGFMLTERWLAWVRRDEER